MKLIKQNFTYTSWHLFRTYCTA